MKKFSPPKQNISFPKLEEAVLRQWRREQTFQRSLKKNPKSRRFTFYDGPPFATGRPHYGHLLQGTIKDIIPRFKTMQGMYVERRFGWDCHGLPVEYELEKKLGIKNRAEILVMGVGKFNDACRSIVLRHTREWQKTTERLGRWIDFTNDYKTMDPDYMESIWWVVKTLWEKDLLYEGRKSMHICPRCATPLSNFEVTLSYRDRQDPSVYVKFPLADGPAVALVAWTTTPWTLPGNVLLAVNPNFTYVEVEHAGQRYILAKKRITEVFQNEPVRVVQSIKADDLIGQRYEPLFPVDGLAGKHYEVVASDVVSEDEGTGVLHVAPAFGEEDMAIGKREKAAFVQHIDITGHFIKPFERLQKLTALAGNKEIVAELKHAGRLLRQEKITHAYPHCWRCDTPLLNYAATSWFVRVTKLKKKLLSENKQIDWVPAHIRDGRFGKWLKGARDWSISRNRFWGNPLPIWKCPDGHVRVIGSRDELGRLSGKNPKDLHKQFVDKIAFRCPDCGGPMTRIEDVLDCWFESGSMPYAERHYPFEHKNDFTKQFPADFIAESLDQTRGWFYTLHVLGVALMDSRAYRNVITTGMVLAEDGKEMSKRLRNYPEPTALFGQYGADAARLYMVMSPIVRGKDLQFSEQGVAETWRSFTTTLWNTYCFFTTYAAIDDWRVKPLPKQPAHLLDRWILSKSNTLVQNVTKDLERYNLMDAARSLMSFLDELSNWYVRRSRRRFWKSQDDRDKHEAYATLYHVLETYCRLIAPFTPFIADHLYRQLAGKESVHLADWPKAESWRVDRNLERQMQTARGVVRLGLAARSSAGVRVRQPLSEIFGPKLPNKEIVQLVKGELNVKSYAMFDSARGSFNTIARPNPKVIAPLAKGRTQVVIQDIKNGKYRPEPDGSYNVDDLSLPAEAIDVQYTEGEAEVVESSSDITISLRTKVTPQLRAEGRAREVIHAFQELRKNAGLAVDNRIAACYSSADPALVAVLNQYRDLIADEILARSLEGGDVTGDNTKSVTIDGKMLRIGLRKTS